MTQTIPSFFSSVVLAAGLCLTATAHAGLFDDDEARRAILDVRQRAERQDDAIRQLQRSLLEQQNQIETLRVETARLRGEKEELSQELYRAKELSQRVEERLKKFEPSKVKVDGIEFLADPAQTKAYEDALAIFRTGDFAAASMAFTDFIQRFPQSGYLPSSLFWLGNAQYANRDYANAIRNFSSLLNKAPQHLRAPEAMLSVANCQLEMKDLKAARKTLSDVVKIYPDTEAAKAAAERLHKLK